MNNFKKIVTGVAFAASMMAGHAMAATDGSLGASSTGTTDVTLGIPDRVQISDVKNLGLGTWSGSGDLVGSTSFCVYRNGGAGYDVTLTTGSGAFDVTSSTSGDTIPFSVKVDDSLDASAGESLSYNTASSNALLGSSSLTCGGSDNATLQFTFLEASLQGKGTAADYTGTVTILVSPN